MKNGNISLGQVFSHLKTSGISAISRRHYKQALKAQGQRLSGRNSGAPGNKGFAARSGGAFLFSFISGAGSLAMFLNKALTAAQGGYVFLVRQREKGPERYFTAQAPFICNSYSSMRLQASIFMARDKLSYPSGVVRLIPVSLPASCRR